eukprot:TRINITY_DN1543_c0_g1_i2.p1 TRINITY_DN1543_c0_g1~~TRINITY_DN1543_c0_g1_i2.p1  ORF type:complete len:555 (+),score=182.82 TRINITY_DN1543_c0_g1_i2:181-1665(+)
MRKHVCSGGSDENSKEFEQRNNDLQKELTLSYKSSAENARNLLNANQELRQAQLLLQSKDQEIDDWKGKYDDAEEEAAVIQEKLRQEKLTVNTLREEINALQNVLLNAEEKIKKLGTENDQLVQRWIQKKIEEADKMNEANVFYSSILTMQKAAEIEKRADADSLTMSKNMSKSSMGNSFFFSNAEICSKPPTKVKRNFIAHKAEITCAAYNSTGSIIATGSADKTVRIWDARSGIAKSVLSGSIQTVMSVKISPNDELVLGASSDNATRIWSIELGRVKHTLTGHTGKVYSGAFSGDNLRAITGGHDRTLKIWDLTRGYCTRTISCTSSCNDLAISADSSVITSGHLDGKLRFFDPRTGELENEIVAAHDGKQITSVTIFPDGNRILTNGRDDSLRIIDIRKYQVLKTFKDEKYQSGLNWNRACISPTEEYVAAGSANGCVVRWNVETTKTDSVTDSVHTIMNTTNMVACVQWSPMGHQMISCDKGGNMVLWE